jgi:hypothetical protein
MADYVQMGSDTEHFSLDDHSDHDSLTTLRERKKPAEPAAAGCTFCL